MFIYCLGAFSSCNGDTWASELATVLDTGLPILITTGKPVPKGKAILWTNNFTIQNVLLLLSNID